MTASVVYWSVFLAAKPEVRVRFPALPDFLSLVSTIKELFGRKRSGSGLEIRDYGCRGSVTLTT
jgi:hypothetical protein